VFFGVDTHLAQTIYKPNTIIDTPANIKASPGPRVESRTIEVQPIEYVNKPVSESYVEPLTNVPAELRNFNNLGEFKQWINKVTPINFQRANDPADCADYAIKLQQLALADGYLMSFQIIEPDKYNSLFASSRVPPDILHAIDLVLIGNGAYYAEPQTGEVVFVAYLN